MTPKEYIYYKRKESGYLNEFGKFDQNHLKEYLNQLPSKEDRQKAEEVWKNRNDKTLSEIWDETATDYKNNILIGLADVPELKKIVDETYIGVLPTGKVNAFATYAPNGERMIIINEGLLYTIHYWSSFFLRTYEEKNDDFFWKNHSIREQSLKWIYSVWNNKLLLDQSVPPIFPKTQDSWNLAQALTLSSIVFVIAHEIGHILHNHNEYTEDKDFNHKMEFDADMIALETTFKYSYFRSITCYDDNYFAKFMLMGPYLVYNILAMFGINNSKTHPSVIDRIVRINTNYKKIALEYLGKEIFDKYMDYVDTDFFERLMLIGDSQLQRHLIYAEELNNIGYNTAIQNNESCEY